MTNALWIEKLDMLPEGGRERIRRYIEEGYGASLSTFYRCLLSNDLFGTLEGADQENLAALPLYVEYLTGYAPPGCFGSAEKLHRWRGLSRGDR
ncbi:MULTISPECIES: hypothetical protein [unclassified Sphingomonas]|uniref:hypothetical protein n=1 Tax=unclassified Sphingomonas TaxID=196159 RepID=UPI002863EA4D|nr:MULTISPECIES: hypothetical protein [unclassified Sphingomonas]MDR6116570.1 hypothetical protein [Sphingomonas sp. SORGH_AS_0789]MDR6149753.1 hypothetical protein [Sphingomonas sp. SORGH_AS_0742]